jgi:putative restriction endonuclease
MNARDTDTKFRLAAIDHLRRVSIAEVVTAEDLRAGFVVDGQRIPFINPQRGIFKPAVMRYLLSVRTVFPVSGRKVWYDDQRRVHEQIERDDELIDYAFMGTDPAAADNRWLREAMEANVPIIYFCRSRKFTMRLSMQTSSGLTLTLIFTWQTNSWPWTTAPCLNKD